ncbi:unnamed protein product [Chondrus crispus]|uniref:Uncharacterized protein n=1 Tax=Chondrus crispus TaxID=2769 RepID=R7QMP2_CHOCR|nr:unnamed protein product [Chondrus crispus]CDF38655.1 unnamed protein product [Chondrus crispus]|eukprot:XP_005718560.1 unnamed protein product [Chondrus crispus]
MKLLDFTVPLGGADVDSEVHLLLDKIESVNWDAIPRQNSSRSVTHQRLSFSPGRTRCAAGDLAWFNPWSGSLSSAAKAQLSRRFGNQIPLPVTELVIPTDPRVSNICTRPSRPSSPRSRVTAATPPVATRGSLNLHCPAGLTSCAVNSLEVPACPSSAISPVHELSPWRPRWRSDLQGQRPLRACLSVQFPKAEGNQPLSSSLQHVTSNPRRVRRLLLHSKIPKNLALLQMCALPSCALMAWRRNPSKRFRWRTSGSSLDYSHFLRKVNPSVSRLRNLPSTSSS